jgi:t-SNARE complex subunit (syntaxin)
MDIPTIPQIQSLFNFLHMKMEQTECSETLAYKIQTPGNYPEENIQHTENGENLKSRSCKFLKFCCLICCLTALCFVPYECDNEASVFFIKY